MLNRGSPVLQALLIGGDTWTLPSLLSRAGFIVDVITYSPIKDCCKFVRNCVGLSPGSSLITAIRDSMKKNYDWFVITEDGVLTAVLESDFSLEEKLKLLPVQSSENFAHLYSKIGLAKTFSKAGIKSPPFYVVHNLREALAGAEKLGYPVLLKKDSSGGGRGIFECNHPSDMNSIAFDQPLLLQKKLQGIELDLSALYLNGELIHFSYAKIEKVFENKFGPSCVRLYRPLCQVEEQIFHELTQIGKALGANGFANVSCIESDGSRFYFEADMRSNAWVNTPCFFNDDPAIRIKKWFSLGETLHYPIAALPNQPSSIRIPYFLRLKPIEILFNRYQVWKFIPGDDKKLMIRLLFRHFFRCREGVVRAVKWLIPQKYHQQVKRVVKSLPILPKVFQIY
jgi:hypothetical protein